MDKFRKYILITSLVAGTLDGLAAVILYVAKTGKDPLNIFRFIASGVLGSKAFTGGVAIGLLGIIFHYLIACGWTILFFVAAKRFHILLQNWIVSGVFYGIVVWLVMNLIVMPLSHISASGNAKWSDILTGISILILCIGLPISFSASRYAKSYP